jgi:GrpB-like predicted nucleotidyltransferase (UPF0157 family)
MGIELTELIGESIQGGGIHAPAHALRSHRFLAPPPVAFCPAVLHDRGDLKVGLLPQGASLVFDDVQPVIGPYAEPPLACREFDPRAAEVARQVAGLISLHLPSLWAEHVGSTAVPGCGGREIVDLLIACPEGDVKNVDLLLDRLGFQRGGAALFPPHPPAHQGAWIHDDDPFLLHVHVLTAGSVEVDSMRFFRACLRADAELTRAYVQHKRAIIAGGVTEAAEYCRQKAAFLKMVLG